RLGTAQNVLGGLAAPRREDVHVAGLRRVELVATASPECRRDARGERRHPPAPRSRRALSVVTRSAARTAAMSALVTFCSPDHAGMLVTPRPLGGPPPAGPMFPAPHAAPARPAAPRRRP